MGYAVFQRVGRVGCPLPLPGSRGLYVLLLALEAPVLVPSRHGLAKLDPGLYAYVGSAGGGLRGRVCRHVVSPAKLRWHIDSLTTSRQASLVLVAWSSSVWGLAWEDRLASTICALGGVVLAPGFGASDSRGGERLCKLPNCKTLLGALLSLKGGWGCIAYASSSLWCEDPAGVIELCSRLASSSAITI